MKFFCLLLQVHIVRLEDQGGHNLSPDLLPNLPQVQVQFILFGTVHKKSTGIERGPSYQPIYQAIQYPIYRP